MCNLINLHTHTHTHTHTRTRARTFTHRFDFCTEVSGFLVRRLSAPSPHGSHTSGDGRPGEAGVAVEGDENKGGDVAPEGCPWEGTEPGSHHRDESRERPSVRYRMMYFSLHFQSQPLLAPYYIYLQVKVQYST